MHRSTLLKGDYKQSWFQLGSPGETCDILQDVSQVLKGFWKPPDLNVDRETWTNNSQATAQTPNSLHISLKENVQILKFSDFLIV